MSAAAVPMIEVPLKFMLRPKEKPRVLMSASHADANTRTGEFRTTNVPILDARSLAEQPTLDREGFELAWAPTACADFFDAEAIERTYYPEVVRLLREHTGAAEVVIFDHTLRVEDEEKRRKHGTRLPVLAVHNDYTERSAPQRVRDMLGPAEAERFLARRYAFINVWRSFGASAESFPLAFADGRTVPQEDYVGVDIVYPDRTGEIYQNVYTPGQRWYWFSKMTREEAVLLKCFDTAGDRTRYTAHSGFQNPHAPAGTPPRESIEVRTMVTFAA